jgi:hypothetical protein
MTIVHSPRQLFRLRHRTRGRFSNRRRGGGRISVFSAADVRMLMQIKSSKKCQCLAVWTTCGSFLSAVSQMTFFDRMMIL